jgi:hypothetical protein
MINPMCLGLGSRSRVPHLEWIVSGKVAALTSPETDGLPIPQDFFRAVCHQVLNEMQEARMLVAATPYMLDVAAICDLLAAGSEGVTTKQEQGHFGSQILPGDPFPHHVALPIPFA